MNNVQESKTAKTTETENLIGVINVNRVQDTYFKGREIFI